MTDREKVVAGLECCKLGCDYGCPYADSEEDCTRNLARDALELLKEREPVGDWISVKDRLPEIFDEVLFTGVNNYGNRWHLAQRGYFDGTFWKRDAGDTIYLPVTHWMPLPEQPEEELKCITQS